MVTTTAALLDDPCFLLGLGVNDGLYVGGRTYLVIPVPPGLGGYHVDIAWGGGSSFLDSPESSQGLVRAANMMSR